MAEIIVQIKNAIIRYELLIGREGLGQINGNEFSPGASIFKREQCTNKQR